jgi:hypothetical protein
LGAAAAMAEEIVSQPSGVIMVPPAPWWKAK